MKKVFAILLSASFSLVMGCRDYGIRMDLALAEMKYQKDLDDNLGDPPPEKSALRSDGIYFRAPKGMKPSEAFNLAPVDAGKFDAESSFTDTEKQASLHVVARVKKPKAAADAKKATPKAEPPARAKFTDDVFELIKTAYNVELAIAQFKPDPKSHGNRTNPFKSYSPPIEGKDVQIYLIGDANSSHEVALIFDLPKGYPGGKIRLCLENFAVGESASRAYRGGGVQDAGEDATGAAPPPI